MSNYHKTYKKIVSFKYIKSSMEDVIPSEIIIQKAIELITEADNLGFTRTNSFLGISGEVRVTIYHLKHYLEFTIETNNTVTYVYEMDDKEIEYKEDLPFEIAKKKIKEFKDYIS